MASIKDRNGMHLTEAQAAVTSALKLGQEEVPHIQGQGQWPKGATPAQGQGRQPGGGYPYVRGEGRQPKRATQHPRSGGCAGAGGPRGATPRSRSGGVALRRYPLSKVRSSSCALLEQLVKRYPTSKVRETQVRWEVLQEGIRGQTH